MRERDERAEQANRDGRARLPPAMPVLTGALAGLILCGLGYLALHALSPRQPDVAPTLRAVCADLTAQRYDHLYTLLDPKLRADGTQAQFIASQRQVDALLGRATTCAAGTPSATGSSVSVAFTLTRGAQTPPAQAALVSESGSWRIVSYSGAF